MTIFLLDVDGSGRVNLNKLNNHHTERYVATEHEDGTVTLTPAIVLTKDQLAFLNDTEIQKLFAAQDRVNSYQIHDRGRKTL